jgi:hypothetical protein
MMGARRKRSVHKPLDISAITDLFGGALAASALGIVAVLLAPPAPSVCALLFAGQCYRAAQGCMVLQRREPEPQER